MNMYHLQIQVNGRVNLVFGMSHRCLALIADGVMRVLALAGEMLALVGEMLVRVTAHIARVITETQPRSSRTTDCFCVQPQAGPN